MDLEAALEIGVDWVAGSFIQQPENVQELRDAVGDRAAIMSKLEKPAAIEQLEEIVALSDGIMVARGDLGVELPPEQVPPMQKRIVRACRQAGKPVIVATQMLESMVNAPLPTRAEASDVAGAIYDGADAVMLVGGDGCWQLPGGGRLDHGPHCRARGARPALLSDGDRCKPTAAAAHHGRRHLRRDARNRAYAAHRRQP